MLQLNIAICDDVCKDAEALEGMLKEMLPDSVIRKFSAGEILLKLLEKTGNPFQLIFLHIQLHGKDGISISEEIRKLDKQVPIFLISDDDRYYKQAFEVFAYQYLIKPITKSTLSRSMAPLMTGWDKEQGPLLYYHYRSQVYSVKQKEIRYISSSLHTVNFHLKNGKIVHCRGKLNEFESQLDPSMFVRCHQSFFVNLESVTGKVQDRFLLGDYEIPISRSCGKEANRRYDEFLKNK